MKTFGTSIVASMIVVGCFAPHLKAGDREHLGKWHDGPRDMAAWYVCEKADLDGCSEAGWSVFEGSCYAVSEELKSYDDAAAACDRLLRAGIPVGNQSVLLAGINDSPTRNRGNSSRSSSSTRRPSRAIREAAVQPAGPPPTTMTS